MRLNLGCGRDHRTGFVNVDFVPPADMIVDLSRFPWPWSDGSVKEIMMLDFLEHFPYSQTDRILQEAARVLAVGGQIHIQVPDFKVCAIAAASIDGYETQCNRCGEFFSDLFDSVCSRCKQPRIDVRRAAIHRLYGGQDRPGNWHFAAFTDELLSDHVSRAGLVGIRFLERNENGETYSQNWNMRLSAAKGANR